MTLTPIDYAILAVFCIGLFGIGFWSMYRAGQNSSEFFLAGRTMPWWLLGCSLVATTFSADTPNLVTDMVRTNGVAGNWAWWAFLLTGMTTVFIYAKMWRRLGVLTDIEFYEVRYSGASGAFLRGFRTLYIGLIFNTVIMAGSFLAMIKILGVLLESEPTSTVIIAGVVTMLFTMLGGFTAVLWADFVLFIIAMIGSVAAAYFCLQLPEIGGLVGLLTHPNVETKLAFFPAISNTDLVVALLIVPLAVQWWSAWYPGAEPGGGSYVAQRMLAAKDETHAVGATLFFNFAHYAIRPWPWILVALASLVMFPDLDSLKEAFPKMPAQFLKHDMAYSAMLTFLPAGWAGLVLASLFAAFMSTIATHLNLGSSYMVNDFHRRFINPNASEKRLVFVGRVWTVILMILAAALSMQLSSALGAFEIVLQVGAGTGLLFLLRWFWWRINAWSEISAMVLSLAVAIYFLFIHAPLVHTLLPAGMHEVLDFSASIRLIVGVGVTTVGWIVVTLLTPPTDDRTLRAFLVQTRACGPGWKKVIEKAQQEGNPLTELENVKWSVPIGLLCAILGCVSVYSCLFATGLLLYGNLATAGILAVMSLVGAGGVLLLWRKVS